MARSRSFLAFAGDVLCTGRRLPQLDPAGAGTRALRPAHASGCNDHWSCQRCMPSFAYLLFTSYRIRKDSSLASHAATRAVQAGVPSSRRADSNRCAGALLPRSHRPPAGAVWLRLAFVHRFTGFPRGRIWISNSVDIRGGRRSCGRPRGQPAHQDGWQQHDACHRSQAHGKPATEDTPEQSITERSVTQFQRPAAGHVGPIPGVWQLPAPMVFQAVCQTVCQRSRRACSRATIWA